MRVIPSILMLLAVTSVSATASAGKYDLINILESILTNVNSDPEKAREDEHARQQQKILDEYNRYAEQKDLELREEARRQQREIELSAEYGSTTCNSIERCNEFPYLRRVISGDLENVPYICELDDPEGASRRVDLEYKVNFTNFVYPSNQWLAAERQCRQRLEAQKEENGRRVIRERDLEYERQQQNERNMLRKMAEKSKLPEPKIGMTKDQVKKSRWGNPLFIELTTNTQGKYEKWSYYSNKALYFKNGKLTKIEQVKSGL